MAFNTAAHRVTKVTITSESRHINSSSGTAFSCRDIIITFDDGTEQTIDLFSAEGVENIIVEIK